MQDTPYDSVTLGATGYKMHIIIQWQWESLDTGSTL